MPTIGQKLEQTRLDLGLTVEDVAHRTRIHPGMILGIEADDFSRFPSVAYAKSFVRKYGDCLGLDLDEAMKTLGDGTALSGDQEWAARAQQPARKARRFRWPTFGRRASRRSGGPRGASFFLNFILATLMAALGIFYFLGYNAPTPEQAKEDIARGLGLPLPLAATPDPGAEQIERNPLRAGAEPLPPEDPAIPAPHGGAPAVAGSEPPRPRSVPAIGADADPPALPPLGDFPAVSKTAPDGQAEPLPEGVDPAAARRGTEAESPRADDDEPPASSPPPQPALRAVPVASSRRASR